MKNSNPDNTNEPTEKVRANAPKAKKTLDKKTRNIILIIIGAVLLVALTITAILVINHIKAVRLEKEMRERPIKIAFYNVDTKAQEAIKNVLRTEWEAASPEFGYEFTTLDSSKSVIDQIYDDTAINLLFSDTGTAASVENLAVKPAESVYSVMPISVRGISKTSVPLLIDDFETLYNIKALSKNESSPSASMEEMISFAKNATGTRRFTFGCAGKDDKTLGMFVSSCMESLYSSASLEKLKKAIQNAEKASDTSQIFDTVLEAAGNENFKNTLDTLCQWKKDGLLHSEWFAMTQQEVEYLMETEILSVVFMPLSMHRTVPYRTIERYTEYFFPVGRVEGAGNDRSLVFSILSGTVLKNKYDEKSALCMEMIQKLLTLENQAAIADATSLAPSTSTAESPDRQASNARLWAAASNIPLAGFQETFTNPDAKTAFFEGLRTYLKIN